MVALCKNHTNTTSNPIYRFNGNRSKQGGKKYETSKLECKYK